MSAVVLAMQDGVFQSRALDGSESSWFETRRTGVREEEDGSDS